MVSAVKSFAVDYNYNSSDYSYTLDSVNGSSGISPGVVIAYIIVLAIVIAGMWKTYKKANQPGWAAIVPVYNTYISVKIAGRPWWWLLLFFIPFVNIIIAIIVSNDIAKAFGKGVSYTLLLVFLPFIGWPMLGFGDAKYKGLKPGKPIAA